MALPSPQRLDATAPAGAEELYRLIAETIPHMVWAARADGRLDFFNHRCQDYTGIGVAGLEGWGWKAVVHPEDWDRCLASWTRALQSGERYEIEYRLRRADGTYRWHHGSAVPLRDASGRPQRWFGTCTDIESDVRSAQILLDRLVAAQESERHRLADELHDLIGQNLTALGIELTSLRQRLAPEPAAGVNARLDAMKTLVEKTIDAIRGVMTGLRPTALEEYGLAAALRAYASEFGERTGLKVAVTAPPPLARLPHEAELALFRIAQEALTNAAKHSGGTRVCVALEEEQGKVRLVVQDDGRGFADPAGARSERRGGWGLPAMRERAKAHGGDLRIEFPGQGTRLVAEIPRVTPLP